MTIKITNYWYQVQGKKYYFANYYEARVHMRVFYPLLYRSCLDVEDYIQKLETVIC